MPLNRRSFLVATLGAGLGGRSLVSAGESPIVSGPIDPEGLAKADIPTPALLVDLDTFELNVKTMADHCRKTGRGFRPHAKTHKCPEIARRQIASGASGVCVATVAEAEAMVRAGIRGVLLTSPIVERGKLRRMVELARGGGDVLLALGQERQLDLLAEAARAAGVTIDVLVDVDVSDRRTGARPGRPALELAQRVDRATGLRLRGLQAYSGASAHVVGFERRKKRSTEAMASAVETSALLGKSGLETSMLSGGSTGTYNIDTGIAGVTELQVGSYVFMDVEYMAIGSRTGDAVYGDFGPSLTVLTTVISASHRELVTVDAGGKAFAASPAPEPKGRPGISYRRFGDEFGALTSSGGGQLPGLGDRLELIVPHCDPTVNLYHHMYAMRGEKIEAIWPIEGRRESVGRV